MFSFSWYPPPSSAADQQCKLALMRRKAATTGRAELSIGLASSVSGHKALNDVSHGSTGPAPPKCSTLVDSAPLSYIEYLHSTPYIAR